MILLIGFGNELRQDDGAGLRLAELMEQRWRAGSTPVRHLAVQQLAPELAVEIVEPGVMAVVFVDTRAVTPDGAETGAAGGVTVTPLASPAASSPSVGHHFQPDVLLAYAALLLESRPAPSAWLVTVPGVSFGHGKGLSQVARAALEAAWSSDDQPLLRLMNGLAGAGFPPSWE
jgi:hydrogenase maturation protease